MSGWTTLPKWFEVSLNNRKPLNVQAYDAAEAISLYADRFDDWGEDEVLYSISVEENQGPDWLSESR